MEKYIATVYRKDGHPIDAMGPIFGDWSRKFEEIEAFAKKKRADYVEVDRRTNGHFITVYTWRVGEKKAHRVTSPVSWGPGLYTYR